MASYLIKKDDNTNEIIFMDYELEGYKFRPKAKRSNAKLKINQITIVKPSMIDTILTANFNKKYKRLVMIVYSILSEVDTESTNGDIMIALDEIAKLRQIILNKYQKFLKKEKEEMFIKQLRILENELRKKQVDIKMRMLEEMSLYEEEKKSFGR